MDFFARAENLTDISGNSTYISGKNHTGFDGVQTELPPVPVEGVLGHKLHWDKHYGSIEQVLGTRGTFWWPLDKKYIFSSWTGKIPKISYQFSANALQ